MHIPRAVRAIGSVRFWRQSATRSLAVALVSLAAQHVAAAPMVWQVATGARADTFQVVNLKQFAADVAAATNGALVLEVHPEDALGKLTEVPKMIQSGKIAAGQALITTLHKQIPTAGADTLPFLVGSYDEARALWRSQKPVLDQELERIGLVGLYASPWPPQGLFTMKPIESAADLHGVTMRTYNPPSERLAELVGARGVNVPRSGLGKALAEGKVETLITSGATGVEDVVWSKMKFFYDIHAWYPKDVMMVSKEAFMALPTAMREAILKAARDAEERGWRASQEAAATSMRELEAHSIKVVSPGFILRSDLHRLGERTSKEWLRSTGASANAILIPFFITSASSRTH